MMMMTMIITTIVIIIIVIIIIIMIYLEGWVLMMMTMLIDPPVGWNHVLPLPPYPCQHPSSLGIQRQHLWSSETLLRNLVAHLISVRYWQLPSGQHLEKDDDDNRWHTMDKHTDDYNRCHTMGKLTGDDNRWYMMGKIVTSDFIKICR